MRRAKQWAIMMMIFTVVFSMFGGTALGASTRFALVTEVTGTVKVTKAGGTKEIRVFNGMGLNEGDKLKVEKDSSVSLKVADRDDEVVLGANWSGTLSKLKDDAGGSSTSVKTWAGAMYNKVDKLSGSNSTYKVETPTAVMGVRGTHFMVSIDPITGLPTMFVSAGRVETGPPQQHQPPVVLLPSQQVTVYPDAPPSAGVGYVDPATIVSNAPPSVISALMKNKSLIDQENEEILEELGGEEGTLDLSEEEALERYRSNVENALFNVLKTAVETGAIDEDEAQEIIDDANEEVQDPTKQFDLNREVPPIDRTAGVDPAAQQQREQLKQAAEQKKQQQVQQKEAKKQEVTTNNAALIQQIVQAAQELQQANEQAQQQKQQEATDRLLNQLTEQQRETLQQRVEQKRQESQQQQRPPQTPPPSSGNNNTSRPLPTTTTVEVSKVESVVGEPLTITATMINNVTGGAVPNGTSVTFRKGSTPIGTAATNDGKAVLTISQSESASLFPMGNYAVSATFSGTNALQSSTSLPVSLSVKSATSVEVTAPDSSAVGAEFTVAVQVNAVSPGSGTPVGTVELYDGTKKLDEKTLLSGKASFAVKPTETVTTTKTYKAVYKPSATALYFGNSYEFKHVVEESAPTLPSLSLQKTDTSDGFDIAVKLDNFTGTKKLLGVQIHFVSERSVEPKMLTDQTHYNAAKFTNKAQTEEAFWFVDGLADDNQPKRESIYALTLFGTGAPVAFDENETMATLKFKRTSMDETLDNIRYVYAQFVFEDGTSYVPNVPIPSGWNY